MQIISFSLFGNNPLYCVGAIRNAEQYPKVLPGWSVRIYHDSTVPRETIQKLRRTNCELIQPTVEFGNSMFLRFLALDDPKVDRVLFRDTDSRPTEREAEAVRAWMARPEPFLSLRDHVHHTLPLGGGLFGIDKTKIKCPMPHVLNHVHEAIVKSRLARKVYTRSTGYSLDQTFLTHHIWPVAKKVGVLEFDTCCRERFTNALPFPSGARFSDMSFVGEIISEHEQPNWVHRTQRLNYMHP